MIISKTAQRLTLFHRSSLYRTSYSNAATTSVGVIFINTNFKGKAYSIDLVQQGQKNAESFFCSIGISNTKVHHDLRYEQVITVFKDLKNEVAKFTA